MDRRSMRGFAPIIIIGIVALLVIGVLYSGHRPGNPPPFLGDADESKMDDPAEVIPAPMPQLKQSVPKEEKVMAPVSAQTPKPTAKQAQNWQPGCTSNTNPKFTHAFTDLSVIDGLNPIGGLGGGSPARSYIGVKKGMEAPIYAPIDATLEMLIYVDRGAGYGEYGIFLRPSCEVQILFDHVDRLSDKLKPLAPAEVSRSSQSDGGTRPNIAIKAGELLGYSNGTDLARTWDFLVTNYGRKNVYLDPARWEWEQAVYGSCPYDYFVPELKATYYEKLGRPTDTGLEKALECGNPSHDKAGTAAGGWFKGDSTDKRGEYLALAREFNGVRVAYRKDGQAFASMQDVQAGKPFLSVSDYSPSVYPEDMSVGGSACFEGNGVWAYVRLDTATQLSVASGTGSCPPAFPEAQAETWIR